MPHSVAGPDRTGQDRSGHVVQHSVMTTIVSEPSVRWLCHPERHVFRSLICRKQIGSHGEAQHSAMKSIFRSRQCDCFAMRVR